MSPTSAAQTGGSGDLRWTIVSRRRIYAGDEVFELPPRPCPDCRDCRGWIIVYRVSRMRRRAAMLGY